MLDVSPRDPVDGAGDGLRNGGNGVTKAAIFAG